MIKSCFTLTLVLATGAIDLGWWAVAYSAASAAALVSLYWRMKDRSEFDR
jgi:hypothetical protein